jgi:deazaflavin-dependent oxidoreductase (nitroreductase family)
MALSLAVRICAVGLLLAALGAASDAAAQPIPLGPQFQVNTYTTASQWSPSVAADAEGGFVVVWQSDGSSGGDADDWSIQGQRYDSAGSAAGSQFQVNAYVTGSQRNPCVAADADGDFVVVWQSYGSPGGDASAYSIQGQRYDSAGSAVGSQFQVNTYTDYFQVTPSVAAEADGDFAVVWASYGWGGDTSGYSIQGQRYDGAGSAVGGQFQVNTYSGASQLYPSVAADADGDFVVVWQSIGSLGDDTNDWSIQGQRYDSAGSAVGGQFQVNGYTTNAQARPSVAANADGDLAVVWYSNGSSGGDTSGYSIQGQRYDSAGSAVGGQFQVNTYTPSLQLAPSVAAQAAGDFVVVWQSNGSPGGDTSNTSIQGQRYTPAAAAVPSLSPAALAGAALLVWLAVCAARRRRTPIAAAPLEPPVVERRRTCHARVMPDFSLFGDEHVRQYEATGGRTGHDWNGTSVLVLHTLGRKSGETRKFPLIYGRDGKDYVIVASRGGSPEHPGWYKNLLAHPDVKIQVRDAILPVTARTASAAEKKRLWPTMTAQWPDYDKYQAATTRDIPVVVLSPR